MDFLPAKELLQIYIETESEIATLTSRLFDLNREREKIGQALSFKVPEDFMFRFNGRYYRFLMDVEDGGVLNFAELNDFDDWLLQQVATDRISREEQQIDA